MSIELANPDIVVALIGGATSILAAIVTVALSRWLDDRGLKVLGGSTRSNVKGRWTGHFDQPIPPPGFPGHVDLEAEFQLKRKRVVGTVHFDINGHHFRLDYKGGFYGIAYSRCSTTIPKATLGNMGSSWCSFLPTVAR